jgi:DNA-binding SARP family transcriptional activator/WD40 repeat protein
MVLAVLLSRCNRVVSRDALIEAVWAGDPPDAARTTLHSYLSNLRAELDDGLVRSGEGYRVDASPENFDALRFEGLVDTASGLIDSEPKEALRLLHEGLALWGGDAYGDLNGEPDLAAEIARLDELRLVAVEYRIEAELALRRHRQVVGELETLVREHPFRERLVELQMLALYRAGRQADALRAFSRSRTILAEELGIDPSAALRDLEQRILEQDPGLTLTQPPEPTGPRGLTITPAAGSSVRGYELREQLGASPRGTVFRAYQPAVGREVAVEFLPAEVVNRPDFVRDFETDARVVAQLEHPHIATLLDAWRGPEGAYLVHPLYRGGSVADTLSRGPWSLAPTLRLVDQIGAAASYAHRHGVVHGEIEASNVLLDGDGNAYLTGFRIARRSVASMTADAPGNRLRARRLEDEPLTAQSDVFGLGVLVEELLTGAVAGSHDSSADVRTVAGPSGEVRAVLMRATDAEPSRRFPTPQHFLRALRRAVGADVVALADSQREVASRTAVANPYKGLRAFTEADAIDFHGRDALVDEVLRTMADHRLVAVVGPSGSGKSSVVRAGVIPALRSGGLRGSGGWLFTDMFPGSHPFEELAGALRRVAVEDPPDLIDDLVADERGLLRVCKQILPVGTNDLVLVIDQFEEVFSQVGSEETRRLFLDTLAVVAADSRSRVRVLVTIRADFFDRPLHYPRFAEAVKASLVTVGPPSRDGLAQAVAAPARRVGVDLEPGLVNLIVRDVEDQPGGLPLLQYALTELYASRRGDVLTIDAYTATGGVQAALGRRAEEVYAALPPTGRAAAEQVFLRLVTVDENGAAGRRRVLQTELKGLGIDPRVLDQVLHQFGAFRLLSFDHHPVTRGPTVEVAHEALLSEWERLAEWVEERRDDLATRRRIDAAAQEWVDAGRDPGFLLSGGRLVQAESWIADRSVSASPDETEYVAASVARRDEEHAGRRRRRRLVFAAVAIGLTALGTLGGLAVVQRRQEARDQALAAVYELANEAMTVVEDDPELAVLLGLASAEQAVAVDGEPPVETIASLNFAVQASRLERRFDGGHRNLELSPDGSMLATDMPADHPASTDETRIWDIETGALVRSLHGPGEVSALSWGPDGHLAVAYEASDRLDTPSVLVWDPVTGEEVTRLSAEPAGLHSVYRAAWSPDGSLVAATAPLDAPEPNGDLDPAAWDEAGGALVVWDIDRSQVVFSETRGAFSDVAFLEDGTLMVARPDVEMVVFLDAATGTERWRIPMPGYEPWRIAVDHDTGTLVVANPAGVVAAWSIDDGFQQWVTTPDVPGLAEVPGLAVLPPAPAYPLGLVAISGNEGRLRLLDLSDGTDRLELAGHRSWVFDLAFDAEGRLHSVGTDGTTRTWDTTADGPPGVAYPVQHQGTFHIDVSPDGDRIAVQSDTGNFDVIDLDTGEAQSLAGQALHISGGAAVSPDWEYVAILQAGTIERGWVRDLETLEPVARLPDCTSPKAFSPDSRLLVLASACDGTPARVIDWSDGETVLDLGEDWFNEAAFNPGGAAEAGRYVVTVIGDVGEEGVVMYDLATGEQVMGPVFPLTVSITFDPEGRYLAGGEIDGGAWVLDLAALLDGATPEDALVFDATAHPEIVWRLRMNADGVLATSSVRSIRLWDVFAGRMIAEPYVNATLPPVSAFNAAGDLLLYADGGAVLRPFYFDADELMEIAGDRVTRDLTPEECERHLGGGCT